MVLPLTNDPKQQKSDLDRILINNATKTTDVQPAVRQEYYELLRKIGESSVEEENDEKRSKNAS